MPFETIEAIVAHLTALGYFIKGIEIGPVITNDIRVTYPNANRNAILLFQEDATLGVLFSDGKGSGKIDFNDPNSIQQLEEILYKGLQCQIF